MVEDPNITVTVELETEEIVDQMRDMSIAFETAADELEDMND